MTIGLEGIVVAETALSKIDGTRGEVIVAGQFLEELTQLTYEEVAARLVGDLELGPARVKAYQHLEPILANLARRQPMEGLRLALACLPEKASPSLIAAVFPVAIAACRHGSSLKSPRKELGQVEDFLRLFFDHTPQEQEVRALATYLATVCEHGLNASTFTARVVTSTRAKPLSAVVAALCALSGPLHGGAPGPVLDLIEQSQGQNLEDFLQQRLQAGQRLMGFGHRVYRTRDPRAEILKKAVQNLKKTERLAWAQSLETAALKALAAHKPDRVLATNVEFYTAVLLDGLGFERNHFTPLFAFGRVLGWLGHVLEQQRVDRLIRPSARYTGLEPGQLRPQQVAPSTL